MMSYTIALIGNPNVGKSTLFNALTDSRQPVGNWPGKTVEKKAGQLEHQGQHFTVIDLPGIYSLSTLSFEEEIAREFLLNDRPNALINVIDAANIERNLYLTTQLLEMGLPLILALNMQDQAAAQGISINARRLSEQLGGLPVISMVARKNDGLETLKQAISQMIK